MDLICGSLAEGAGLRGSAASALAGAAIPGDQRFRIRAWGFQERRFDRSASGAPPSGGSAASSGQGPGPFDGTAASSASAPRNRPQVAPSKAAAVAPASLRPGQQESKAPPKSTGPWKQVPPWHQTRMSWPRRSIGESYVSGLWLPEAGSPPPAPGQTGYPIHGTAPLPLASASALPPQPKEQLSEPPPKRARPSAPEEWGAADPVLQHLATEASLRVSWPKDALRQPFPATSAKKPPPPLLRSSQSKTPPPPPPPWRRPPPPRRDR